MGGIPQNAHASAYIDRVDKKIRGIGHRMVSEQFTLKFESVSRSASDKGQMVADLFRVGNRIRTIRIWPPMIK
jgi:hypothetical protein